MRRHGTATMGPGRWGRRLAAGLLGLSLCGCVTWDDVTSREFHLRDLWTPEPSPLIVLRDSHDGDKRAKAFRALQEPKLNGGSDQDQDEIVKMLAVAARQETRYYVRLEAARKLGEFKDPRAVPALVEAYYQADSLLGPDVQSLQTIGFTRTTVNKNLVSTFRCEVLRGLGVSRGPAADAQAVEMLARALRQPRPARPPVEPYRMVMDECLAAARSLRSYPQYNSTEALLVVLKNDDDVALRDCATESLQVCTGEKLPADYATWNDFLHRKQGDAVAGQKKKGPFDFILTGFGSKP